MELVEYQHSVFSFIIVHANVGFPQLIIEKELT